MAAVLACGPRAFLSHSSAGALWSITDERRRSVHVSLPASLAAHQPGVIVHRRSGLHDHDVVEHEGIRVTSPALTIVDIASTARSVELERAINEADRLDLIDPELLLAAVETMPRRPGRARVRDLLDRRAFTLVDSELERRFVPIAQQAGLPPPLTQQWLNGFRVDFYWPELGLVVETDGLRYHRTPSQQARDRERDQAHTVAGLVSLRFTHAQIRCEALRVEATLRAVAARLRIRGQRGGEDPVR
jgi:very-short-patch-repair endonuclease